MYTLLVIFLGSGVGGVCRYALGGWVQRATGSLFPVGTLAVNLLGCLVIGALAARFAGPQLVRPEIRLGLLIGVLGGFTTFSSFAFETLSLVNDREFGRAALNLLLTNALCLTAVWFGYRAGVRWFGA
ncbi:MAG: fluoride efflux transporter CrcB [Phycisphaerae bacterium]|nr:fluoride efflux transporter CrcB [Phycisphaerae bacterium]